MSIIHLLPKTSALGLLLCLCCTGASAAATATTEPVGYNTVALLANSDTYVSVPFHRPAVFVGQVASLSGNVITVAGTPGWKAGQFVYAAGSQANTYYVFIRSGIKEGNYYTVVANSATTLSLDLAGDTLTGLAADDMITLIPYWTLGTLFPAADAGVSFTASSSPLAIQTFLFMPNMEAYGINLSTSASYYFYNGAWRLFGQDAAVSRDNDIFLPDSYFIVRNGSTSSTLTETGNVLLQKSVTPLLTYTEGRQDNPVALARPVPVTLDDSGLISSGAFSPSSSPLALSDLLLAFDNSLAEKNKPASATYYYYNGAWRKFGADASLNFGSTIVFGPNSGVQIRKASSSNGASTLWVNTPTY